MKSNTFLKMTNYEKTYLALTIILGVLYIVIRNLKTDNAIIVLFLILSIIIILILTYVFAYKIFVSLLRTLWSNYAKNGNVICGVFAILNMAVTALLLLFMIAQIVSEQTKPIFALIEDIIIAITPVCVSLLGVHYKMNFPKSKEKKRTVVIHRFKGGCNNGKQICKKSCLCCYRKIRVR